MGTEKTAPCAGLSRFFPEERELGPGSPAILRVAVTGGIGSGKSYLCKRIEAAGHPVFYCDDEAKRIIRTDPEVRGELRRLAGEGVYDADGRLVKHVLAAYLCRGREYAARVDAIVHPRVARAFAKRAKEMETQAGADFSQNRDIAAGTLRTPGTAPALETDASPTPASFLRLFPQRDGSGRPQPVPARIEDVLAACPAGRVLFMECALLYESGFDRLVHRTLLVHVAAETQVRRVMERDGVSREAALSWMALQLGEDDRLSRADVVIDNEAH